MNTKNIILAKDKEHLKQLIKNEIKLHGHQCNLNHIDTSNLTDLSYLFEKSIFNGDISNWNIFNVTDMFMIFSDNSLEKPWWAITDNDSRKVAIQNYHLNIKLQDKLLLKNIHSKKIKI